MKIFWNSQNLTVWSQGMYTDRPNTAWSKLDFAYSPETCQQIEATISQKCCSQHQAISVVRRHAALLLSSHSLQVDGEVVGMLLVEVSFIGFLKEKTLTCFRSVTHSLCPPPSFSLSPPPLTHCLSLSLSLSLSLFCFCFSSSTDHPSYVVLNGSLPTVLLFLVQLLSLWLYFDPLS